MPLSLSICSQSGPPICTSFWAFFRAFKASRAPEGPQIKFSHILMHRPYRDLHNLKFSCLYLIPFAHKVVPQKASGRGGGGRIPHFNGGGGGPMANNGEKWRKMAMANSAFSFVKFAIFRQFLILEFQI